MSGSANGAGGDRRRGEPKVPPAPRCQYCGLELREGSTCRHHADLPALERELRGEELEPDELALIRAWRPGRVKVPRPPRRP